MKRHLVSIAAAAFVAAFLCVSVSSAQDAKYGFVDIQQFMKDSKKFQDQQKKLMTLFEMKKSALETKAQELQKIRDGLQMLNDAAKNEKIKEATMKETELKLAEQEAKGLLQAKEQSMMKGLQDDLQKIVAKIRQDKRLSLVFNSAALLSADDALNVTREVAAAYDADPSTPSEGNGSSPAPKPKAAAPAAPAKPKAPGVK